MIRQTLFENIDKRRIYELMNLFLSGQIDAWTFCDEYHICYGLNVDLDTLTESEANAFNKLAIVAGRFSKFEEDLKNYPGTYFTEEELKNKVIETREALQLQNKE